VEKKRLGDATADRQRALGFVETAKDGRLHEYAVTSLAEEILAAWRRTRSPAIPRLGADDCSLTDPRTRQGTPAPSEGPPTTTTDLRLTRHSADQ
jgi:hypothetical protein